MTDRFIQITTALAVATVEAVISYRHADELMSTHGESDVGRTRPTSPWTELTSRMSSRDTTAPM